MTSTLSSYLMVSNNMSTWQKITQAQPSVKLATAYYDANIGNVKNASRSREQFSLVFLCDDGLWTWGYGELWEGAHAEGP